MGKEKTGDVATDVAVIEVNEPNGTVIGVTESTAPNREPKRTRKPKATIDDIRLMSRHLHGVHGVNSGDLFAQPFSDLSKLHATFHGQDDHWRKLDTTPDASAAAGK